MNHSTTRRDFLKLTTASLTLPGSLGAMGESVLHGEDKTIRTVCEMCSSRCSIEVRVVDGKPVWIQGNSFDKTMKSSICAKGIAGISQYGDKDRIIKPLIRVGKRGENRWREVSFTEAIEYISQKMKRLKLTYGAQSMVFSSKTGESYDLLHSFASHYGSPNIFSHWSSCPIAIESAFDVTIGERMHRDFEHTNYILNFGHNLFEGLDIPLTKVMAQFAANPSKTLTVVEPRFSIMAAKANRWLPIKPGSDLAFLLALIHVWLRDGKYDKAFVEENCIGLEALKSSTKETTPKWQEAITGIEGRYVESVADELYRASPKCIIDWGHKATTSPAEFQRSRAIVIANILMGNVEKEGGIYFSKTPKRLNALANEIVMPELQNGYPITPVEIPRLDGAGLRGMYEFVPHKHGVLNAIPEAILHQSPYALKGWFMSRHNPLITVANPQKMREAMECLELIVVHDIYISDTAMMADVILPEPTYLERDEGIRVRYDGVNPIYTMRNQTLKPTYPTMSLHEVIQKLSASLDIASAYPWRSIPELRAYQAHGNAEVLSRLSKRGIYAYEGPAIFEREAKSVERFCDYFTHAKKEPNGLFSSWKGFIKTPSKKIELMSERVESRFLGYGVPSAVDMDVKGVYPYILTSGKSAIHTNGHTHNVPVLHQLMKENPVWMHPSTAREHGLKHNDVCFLENAYGKESVRVFITEGIRPDTLFLYMGFGRNAPHMHNAHQKGSNVSKLLSLRTAEVCSAMLTNVGVKIVKV